MRTPSEDASDPSRWRVAKWWARALLAALLASTIAGPALEGDAFRLAPAFFAAGLVVLPAALVAGGAARTSVGQLPSRLVRYGRFSGLALLLFGLPGAGNATTVVGRIMGGAVAGGGIGVLAWSWIRSGDSDATGERQGPEADAPGGSIGVELPFVVGCAVGLFLIAVHFTEPFPPERAAEAVMKRELRSLRESQATYAAREGRSSYTNDVATLRQETGLWTSADVMGPRIRLTPDGYIAEVTHREAETRCVIFVGSTPVPPASEPGKPVCSNPSAKPGMEPLDFTMSMMIAHGLAVGLAAALLL